MNIRILTRLSGMILLALAVTIGILALVYALQNPHIFVNIASIGWNGLPAGLHGI